MPLNCGVEEDSWVTLGLQADPTSPSWKRSVLGVHWKDWCWSWNSNIWPPDAKSWLIGKDPDDGKDWGQEEKGTAEDETVGWHHQLNGEEFRWTLGVGDGQGGLVSAVHRVAKSRTRLSNWTELIQAKSIIILYLRNLEHLVFVCSFCVILWNSTTMWLNTILKHIQVIF